MPSAVKAFLLYPNGLFYNNRETGKRVGLKRKACTQAPWREGLQLVGMV